MRRTLIFLAGSLIIVMGLWGTAVLYLDEARLQRLLSSHFSEQSGRHVEIRGSVSLQLFPGIRIDARDVIVSGPPGQDGPALMNAEQMSVAVRMWPLLRGQVQPSEVSVTGAAVNLYRDERGRATFDGLLGRAESADNGAAASPNGIPAGAAMPRMRLEDVRVDVSGFGLGPSGHLQIENVVVQDFALDRTVEFHFEGNVGDPALFSSMIVDGLLHVPSSREQPIRLGNMRLRGALADSGEPLVLLGQMSVDSRPAFGWQLDDGRLELSEQALGLQASYMGGERGQMRVQGESEMLSMPADPLGIPPVSDQLVPLLRGMDLELALNVEHLEVGGLSASEVLLELGVEDGVAELSQLAALLPGGVLAGNGRWDLMADPAAGRLDLSLVADDLAESLPALGLPGLVSGSGQIEWRALERPARLTPVSSGEGRFEFWEGRWVLDDGEEFEFERMAGTFLKSPGRLDVPELELRSAAGELTGLVSLQLDEGELVGHLVPEGEGQEIALSGQWRSASAESDGDGQQGSGDSH
ncbi:AsmA family protein [Wenzhouxiangella sp. AB-CW3]|uniref:AsmA family protein n=1 Tax=Wenzhouxiangella sp. AB-CW3 TaxID=2771012 RepID=UPI00168ACB06|nr:AsmA family protein [Wenzhouxiangella sp. AB-CW3]QOC23401.1 AsmA family protein [Wenzhouxiangella sp. AB-CW3]